MHLVSSTRRFRAQACQALACVGAGFAMATTASAAPHKQIDLRNQSDASGEYSISLCARPSPGPAGLPGHAFVAYSFLPASGQNRQFLAVGFTTDAAVKGLLSFNAALAEPPGYLGEELFTHVKEKCLVLLVNKAGFDRAYAKLTVQVPGFGNLKYLAVYRLTQNDCVTFMTGVASLFAPQVKVPPRKATDLPLDYLRKVIDAN